MTKTITFQDFCDEFKLMNRDENFSYEGKKALFGYFEEMESQTLEPIELDVIALCCEYTEYENMQELQTAYPDIKTVEELEDKTTVIPIEGADGFIIADF